MSMSSISADTLAYLVAMVAQLVGKGRSSRSSKLLVTKCTREQTLSCI